MIVLYIPINKYLLGINNIENLVGTYLKCTYNNFNVVKY